MTRRKCCCGSNPCTVMCSAPWQSSYSVTGLSGLFNYAKTTSATPECLCVGQSAQGFTRNWNAQISWTQDAPIVITRQSVSAGVCCYYGQGTVTLSATVTVEEILMCCERPFITVNATQTIQRTGITVPVCVSLVCFDGVDECTATGGTQKMNLNVCLCDFPLAESVQLNNYDDLGDVCTFELLPDTERGLVMGGICWYYEAQLKPPNTVQGAERSIGGLCSTQGVACDTYGSTQTGVDAFGCMPCVRDSVISIGPFGIMFVEPFTFGIDEPNPCSCPLATPVISLWNALIEGCTPLDLCSECVDFTTSTDCCELIVSRTLPWPAFT